MILWQLFISYLKIGFFGFGGGYARTKWSCSTSG